MPQQRKTKNDKRAKRRYRVYKKGGSFRTVKLKSKEEGKRKRKK